MRQDAPRSIGEQLNRPDISGCAGFKIGNAGEIAKALKKWEIKNDPLQRTFKGFVSRKPIDPSEQEEEPVVVQKKKPSGESSYKQKLKTLPPEEVEKLRIEQREKSRIRNQRNLQERLASMTPEEIVIFRERSERMKRFRAELKERKNKQ